MYVKRVMQIRFMEYRQETRERENIFAPYKVDRKLAPKHAYTVCAFGLCVWDNFSMNHTGKYVKLWSIIFGHLA